MFCSVLLVVSLRKQTDGLGMVELIELKADLTLAGY